MANRAAVFIDGGYLSHVLKKEYGTPSIRFDRLSRVLLSENEDLLRTYYYHCLPWMSEDPTPEEQTRYDSMRSFIDAISALERFEVRLGQLVLRGLNAEDRPIFEQKRLDVMLACDLLSMALMGRIQTAILLTADSNYLPVIRLARQAGVLVRLVHGDRSRPHGDLWRECDERMLLTRELIDEIL